ncbi:uncharacterized protein PpBr36_10194 [Pyricularia pennisetigena]|uniref:uncharacterized protein n=1 Tax=Pyricularia pennisetigena TaxID=1578925 RepID=UPI001154A67D|nr:uncharacterized protein PpBr36_10194 [Pyricularia pennisetigena]TLS21551.1 hypothetical protein PpBr36_10194 [Pyricularia pennisetigena]
MLLIRPRFGDAAAGAVVSTTSPSYAAAPLLLLLLLLTPSAGRYRGDGGLAVPACTVSSTQHEARPIDDKDAAAEAAVQILPHAAQDADAGKRVSRVRKVLNVRAGAARDGRLGGRGGGVGSYYCWWWWWWWCSGAQEGREGGARGLGGAPAVAQREDELCGGGAKGVHLQLGELVRGQVGAEAGEDARGLDGACVVGQDDDLVGLVVLQRRADGVVEDRVGRQGRDGSGEWEEDEVQREPVGSGQEGGDGPVEEAGEEGEGGGFCRAWAVPYAAPGGPTRRLGLCRPRLAVDGLSGVEQPRDPPDHAEHWKQPTSEEDAREEQPHRRGKENHVELNGRQGQLQNQVGKLAPPGGCILLRDAGTVVGEQALPCRKRELGQQLGQRKGVAAKALRQGLLLRTRDGAAGAVDQRRDELDNAAVIPRHQGRLASYQH